MLWIRQLERTIEAKNKRYSITYELVSECEIPRRLWYKDGLIACQSLGKNSYLDGLYTYHLKFILPEYQEPPRDEESSPIYFASKDGYFSRSYADEITSLLSLFLHTRFFTVNWVIGEHTENSIAFQTYEKFVHLPCKNSIQKKSTVFSPKNKDLWPIAESMEKVIKLRPELHQKYYFAVTNYARALRLIGFEDELAYIHLVSAISALSSTNSRKDRQEFIDFIKKYGDSYFSKMRPGVPRCWITRENLEQYLGTIYTARSEYLHAGIPMWISDEHDPSDDMGRGYDLDFAAGMIKDQREWGEFDRLPTVLFFDDLVRVCLIEYLGRNSNSSSI